MRPFVTPLFEVSAEVCFAHQAPVDFPGRTFAQRIADRFLLAQQFPVVFLPSEQMTPEQLQATPPIYRFESFDSQKTIFIGPRIIAANTRRWNGYPEYRSHVEESLTLFFDLFRPPPVYRHSLGFYNRIPVSSVDELREIIQTPLDLRGNVALAELVAQSARMTDVGSVLTQILMMKPDTHTVEPYLAVNNIIRSISLAGTQAEVAAFLGWLDRAHEIGREAIWDVLSEKAKESWRTTSAK